MTKDEFKREYAQRSGVTVEYLHDELGRYAIPCSCDYEHCQGWQMVSRRDAEEFALSLAVQAFALPPEMLESKEKP